MNKFLLILLIIILIIVLKQFTSILNVKIIFPHVSSFVFGRICCQLDLEKYKKFDDYLESMPRKKRKELNKIIKKEYDVIDIKEGKIRKEYIIKLWEFIGKKYKSKFKKIFNIGLALLLISTNEISYWEYYDKKTNIFLGWSSYFIHDNIYYDFLSSPNEFNISVIGINSIKYCIENSITKIDFGPTNCKLKMQKFMAEIIEL